MIRLEQLSRGSPYVAYAYSYPHKTAYRRLDPPRQLREVWAAENKDALYLYLHVPFCEMRCGFCNLFTTANPREELTDAYLAALRREARGARDALGPATFARMAIGGGTPTYLHAAQLEQLFQIARELFAVDAACIPVSVETSPRTADMEKLGVLSAAGVSRISIGVQSFVEAEVNASGRAQKNEWVATAIERIRKLAFPTLNIDLIYGLPGQSVQSWICSLEHALRWQPEELYLYPLYIRPLTGLDRWGTPTEDDVRLACYRQGRDLLLAGGYEQVSMRMFRKVGGEAAVQCSSLSRITGVSPVSDEPSETIFKEILTPRTKHGRDGRDTGRNREKADASPVYCCQEDGMLSLGCGARSYTRALHYSSDYAVGATGVREIVSEYVAKSEPGFDSVHYGCELDIEEQKRRWLIKSLLRNQGLRFLDYRRQFGTDAHAEFPELTELRDEGFIDLTADLAVPTPAGLERSDAVGPWLFSFATRARMAEYQLR